jgi:hypothetical protein
MNGNRRTLDETMTNIRRNNNECWMKLQRTSNETKRNDNYDKLHQQ